ncbi:hypothetical protein B7G54_13805 [Burkholderia puraquae]|uniref:OmpA-like domain-containing protein n=2 Tax=Burkholderia puraquae TaxID=1904757 RepID=A0A1X1PH59_9BURK|nr:hypothetical protein [Burkholderia puraquae]ORT85641.1 hypothetical protein B7G54_13805 [Burkholderia puraquae]
MKAHIKDIIRSASAMLALFAYVGITPSHACTIGESVRIPLPLNSIDVSNADRLRIADAVIEAKKWPGVEIQAVVISGAYTKERSGELIKDKRAMGAVAYLKQLGIKNENIIVEKKTFTNDMVRKRDGTLDLYQIDIELAPLCRGGCQRLCDDPRVTPRSRAIQ